jgi:hypothetical protein
MAEVAETIEESGRRIGHHEWIELRLFETLGRWAASMPHLDAKVLLAAQSHHHAWHAELWHGLLPTVGGVSAADLVLPADEGHARLIDALASPREPDPPGEADRPPEPGQRGEVDRPPEQDRAVQADSTIERLAGLYRVVLPRLIASYTDHLSRTTAVADGPTIRALRLVLADEIEDWRAGEILVQELLRTPDDVDRACAHQARLERLLTSPERPSG